MKTKKLHKIAPTLSSISNKGTGFQIPKNYFESIEDSVLGAISEKKLPISNNIENFKIPENYFETVEDDVFKKLNFKFLQNKNNEIPENYFETFEDKVFVKLAKKQKVITLKNNVLKYTASIAIAASLTLIFILNTNNNTSKITFESLETSDIEQLVQSGLIDVNTITLSSAFPDFNIDNSINNSIISDEDLLNYLGSENLESLLLEN